MNWLHLLEAAKLLAGQTGAPVCPASRPRQAMLKRAVSTAYYAMFHALCHSNANALIGASTGPSHLPAWTRTYRALEHNFARERMRQHRASIPSAVQNFGVAFRVLQENRHIADYDPDARLLRSDVVNLIGRAETATQAFLASSPADRRALATIVLLRDR